MAGDSFPIDAAQMVGLFMESVFYGMNWTRVYLVSFFCCLRALLWSEGWFKPLHRINKMMLFVALLMFIFSTLDVTFHLRRNLEAFIYFGGDPHLDFDNTSERINVMAMVFYVLQTFIGDSILIFRCWVVYERNWVVVAAPVILWLARLLVFNSAACGAVTIYTKATLNASARLFNSSTLEPFITSMLCLTLATNILTTSLIANRIWTIRRSLKQSFTLITNSPLTAILVALIQSGLMYTFSVVILFTLYMASNNGQYGVPNAIVQIIGITFNLMITNADRDHSKSSLSHLGRSHLSNQDSQANVALHMINVQTTVSRFGDPVKSESDVENSSSKQVEWGSN